jgi:TolA-binding protein
MAECLLIPSRKSAMRFVILSALLLASAATPAFAQETNIEGRVGKIERELRAVQRKVFPGGSGAMLEPEITAAPAPDQSAGQPASAPLADLTARVDGLERELANLTGQIEQSAYKARQTEEAFAKFKSDAEFRLNALEALGKPPAGQSGAADAVPPAAASTDSVDTSGTDDAVAKDADPAPSTGDAGEDAYLAAYKLWEAKRFPAAQAALKAVVAKYPKHARASYARNLLGRAYLDDGKAALAAQAFLDNYQKDPQGERAPDSLYYLGQSLTRLKKSAEACKAYDELQDVYGSSLREPLKGRVAQGRLDAKCAA